MDPVVDTQKNRLDENDSFEHRKQMLKLMEENIHNITLENFAYLDIYMSELI